MLTVTLKISANGVVGTRMAGMPSDADKQFIAELSRLIADHYPPYAIRLVLIDEPLMGTTEKPKRFRIC